jgi:MFS family permease
VSSSPAGLSQSRAGGAYAAFSSSDFRFFFLARLSNSFGTNIMIPALGWQVYALTRSPLALGLIGLSIFVPVVVASIPAGQMADHFERRATYQVAQFILVVTASLFCALSLDGVSALLPYYLCAGLFGAAKTLSMPVASAWMPHLIDREHFPRAVSWTSSTYQITNTVGPVFAGWALFLGGEATIYALAAGGYALSLVLARCIGTRSRGSRSSGVGLAGMLDGLSYICRNRLILAAVTLDVVALLLGGATALLPAYAYDVLHVGERGFGLLRAAPALGSLLTGLWLAHHPLNRRAGAWLFASILLYGLSIVVFGLSKTLILSLLALFVLGATEMMGGFIRQTLIQLSTHDDMRGRVTATNMMFVSARNELGEMESGFLASLIGLIPAVVAGGIATIIVAGLWARLFPALRQVDRLTDAANLIDLGGAVGA